MEEESHDEIIVEHQVSSTDTNVSLADSESTSMNNKPMIQIQNNIIEITITLDDINYSYRDTFYNHSQLRNYFDNETQVQEFLTNNHNYTLDNHDSFLVLEYPIALPSNKNIQFILNRIDPSSELQSFYNLQKKYKILQKQVKELQKLNNQLTTFCMMQVFGKIPIDLSSLRFHPYYEYIAKLGFDICIYPTMDVFISLLETLQFEYLGMTVVKKGCMREGFRNIFIYRQSLTTIDLYTLFYTLIRQLHNNSYVSLSKTLQNKNIIMTNGHAYITNCKQITDFILWLTGKMTSGTWGEMDYSNITDLVLNPGYTGFYSRFQYWRLRRLLKIN